LIKRRLWTCGLIAGLIAGLLLVGGCFPASTGDTGTQTTSGFDWTTLVFFVVIIVIFYFILIRPQNSRRKQQQKLLEQLKEGDQVVTTSGIYGQIESLEQDSIVLKIESGAKIRVTRQSVTSLRS